MRIPIRQLGSGGLSADIPAFDIPPNAVTRAQNVEFRDGAITRALGFSRANTVPGEAVWMDAWYSDGNGRLVVISEDSGDTLFSEIIGGVLTDITQVTPLASGYEWDSAIHGKAAVFTNGETLPLARKIGDTGDIAEMPNWPATWRADIIRSYRNFMVALKVTKDAVYDDTRVQWSNASANNDLPPDWSELDPASLAGGTSLAGQDGPIVDAAVLGQSLIIYMQTAAYAMTLGGSLVMNFRPLFKLGLVSRGCVIPFDSFHFCIGNGLIYVTDGNSIKYPADQVVQTQFFNELADPSSIHLANDTYRRTIEVYYKSIADLDLPNRVLRWNYQNNTWAINDYGDYGVARAKFAPDSQSSVTYNSVDTDLGSGTVVTYNGAGISYKDLDVADGQLSMKLLVRSPTDSALVSRTEVVLRDGVEFESLAEREYMDFDEMLGEANPLLNQSVKHTKRIVPQVTGSGTIYFQFGTSMNPAQGTNWSSIYPYVIGTDYKVDFRQSGRYFAWRVYNDTSSPCEFRLSGFDLDLEVAGER
jgi:hypothetical protein